jgi:hypothetical protein
MFIFICSKKPKVKGNKDVTQVIDVIPEDFNAPEIKGFTGKSKIIMR